jgi:tetratricopeptide (TPR) repeat protein
MLQNRGEPAACRHSYEQAIRTWNRLVEKHPIAEYRNGLGLTYSNLGENLIAAGRLFDAAEAIQKAIDLNKNVVQENPTNQLYRKRLAESLEQLARQRLFAGMAGEAQEACQRALAISAPLAQDNPAVIEYQERRISNHIVLGHVLLARGQDAEAQHSFQTALELGNKLSGGTPNYFSYASIHRGLGKLYRKQGQTAAALEALQKAVHIGETNPGGEKPYTTYEIVCALALCSIVVGEGKAEFTAAEQASKRRYAERAMETLKQAIAEGWENVTWMNQDPDLDALRDRDDFKTLLAELASGKEARKKP